MTENYRPHSQKELANIRNYYHGKLNLSNKYALHHDCRHFYRVKINGKKYKDIINNIEIGNCSVCWKIRENNIPKNQELINTFGKMFDAEPEKLTIYLIELENNFYKWLYNKRK